MSSDDGAGSGSGSKRTMSFFDRVDAAEAEEAKRSTAAAAARAAQTAQAGQAARASSSSSTTTGGPAGSGSGPGVGAPVMISERFIDLFDAFAQGATAEAVEPTGSSAGSAATAAMHGGGVGAGGGGGVGVGGGGGPSSSSHAAEASSPAAAASSSSTPSSSGPVTLRDDFPTNLGLTGFVLSAIPSTVCPATAYDGAPDFGRHFFEDPDVLSKAEAAHYERYCLDIMENKAYMKEITDLDQTDILSKGENYKAMTIVTYPTGHHNFKAPDFAESMRAAWAIPDSKHLNKGAVMVCPVSDMSALDEQGRVARSPANLLKLVKDHLQALADRLRTILLFTIINVCYIIREPSQCGGDVIIKFIQRFSNRLADERRARGHKFNVFIMSARVRDHMDLLVLSPRDLVCWHPSTFFMGLASMQQLLFNRATGTMDADRLARLYALLAESRYGDVLVGVYNRVLRKPGSGTPDKIDKLLFIWHMSSSSVGAATIHAALYGGSPVDNYIRDANTIGSKNESGPDVLCVAEKVGRGEGDIRERALIDLRWALYHNISEGTTAGFSGAGTSKWVSVQASVSVGGGTVFVRSLPRPAIVHIAPDGKQSLTLTPFLCHLLGIGQISPYLVLAREGEKKSVQTLHKKGVVDGKAVMFEGYITMKWMD
jgi:hypothetical protein